MWTGPDVSLINLNAASMEQPNRLYGRKMFFWWNYPVNDYCIDRLLVDRVTGWPPTCRKPSPALSPIR